jgi:N-acetylmuramoyl-L-alanine amidase CwlA
MARNYNYSEFKTAVNKAIKGTGIKAEFQGGWNSAQICPFGVSPDAGIILHETNNSGAKGNAPSLYWCINNQYFPVRAAHFLIGRDGTIYVLSGRGSYHAGQGNSNGGYKFGGQWVGNESGNRRAVGIEIESQGRSTNLNAAETDVDGVTRKQVRSTIRLIVELCFLMDVTPNELIGHKEWSPGRKPDPWSDMNWWRKKARRRYRRVKALRALKIAR